MTLSDYSLSANIVLQPEMKRYEIGVGVTTIPLTADMSILAVSSRIFRCRFYASISLQEPVSIMLKVGSTNLFSESVTVTPIAAGWLDAEIDGEPLEAYCGNSSVALTLEVTSSSEQTMTTHLLGLRIYGMGLAPSVSSQMLRVPAIQISRFRYRGARFSEPFSLLIENGIREMAFQQERWPSSIRIPEQALSNMVAEEFVSVLAAYYLWGRFQES